MLLRNDEKALLPYSEHPVYPNRINLVWALEICYSNKNEQTGGADVRTKTIPIYLLCAAIGAAAYIFLSINTEWTLLPYTKALHFLFGFHFYYTGAAYESAGSSLVISKTCSGINLFLSLYTILVVGFLHRFSGTKKRLFASLGAFATAIFIAYFTTLIRIIISLPLCDSPHFKLIHTVISLCIFFGTGLLVYCSAQKVMRRIHHGLQHQTV